MREWAVAALDLVFPARCPVCESALGVGRRDPLCGVCWSRIERIERPLCEICGLPFSTFERPSGPTDATPRDIEERPGLPGTLRTSGGSGAMSGPPMRPSERPGLPGTLRTSGEIGGHVRAASDDRCPSCAAALPAFDWARAGGTYAGPLREAVQRLKFARRPALARPLAALILEQWAARLGHVDAVLPVPLARARERERGFNQATLLAERVASEIGARLQSRWLARTRDTAPQTDLDVRARRANVRGAFVASPAAAGLDLVLVDDVLTTGATASECARVLRAAGARRVGVLTVARVL